MPGLSARWRSRQTSELPCKRNEIVAPASCPSDWNSPLPRISVIRSAITASIAHPGIRNGARRSLRRTRLKLISHRYAVGRNRPPVKTQFAAGDGRKRGRRKKGVVNADTHFQKELARKIVVRENGKVRKISKGQAVHLKLLENALVKGQNKAIEMIFDRTRAIEESNRTNGHRPTLADQNILEAYLRSRAAELQMDPAHYGDPIPDLDQDDCDD